MDRSKIAIVVAAVIVPLLMLFTQFDSAIALISSGVVLVVAGVVAGMPLWRQGKKYVIASVFAAMAVAALVITVAVQ